MADSAKCLVAIAHIQIHSTRYKPGDLLPTENESDVAAWLEAGSAAWVPVEDLLAPKAAKARPVVAQPGLPGIAVGGEATGDDLVGRVPKTAERGKGKCKASRSKKQ